ncbi:MAG: cytochrome C [Trichlorobacter sp.]|nr:cytochrome C [Trichlorobacter sp.]
MKIKAVILTITIALTLVAAAVAQQAANLSPPASHPDITSFGKQLDCSECHTDAERGTLKPLHDYRHSRQFIKDHRFYGAKDDRTCAVCHKTSFCNDCHTNQTEMKPSIKKGNRPDMQMPHPGNYMTTHKIEGKLNPASCYRCHGRANNQRCFACHR